MIQDIQPNIYRNEYLEKQPKEDSKIMIFNENTILCKNENGKITYPSYKDLANIKGEYIYLFVIDDIEYFLIKSSKEISIANYTYENINICRQASPKYNAFAGVTSYQLSCWYNDNRFCGRCGSNLRHDHKERMMFCDECKNAIYPKISPAVIVGITNGDKLLMTKYAGREYTNYALVAGFTEIGEAIERTVEREVMEEVGLKVKNITYYKSQPWSFSGTLLLGFFAEVDGDTKITMDEEELSVAEWISRDDIEYNDNGISLTGEMISEFKKGLTN